jgi:hypothetical protein
MKAKFVNETYEDFSELVPLCKKITTWAYKKYSLIKMPELAEMNEIELLNDRSFPLSSFSNYAKKDNIKKFMNCGIGLILGNMSDNDYSLSGGYSASEYYDKFLSDKKAIERAKEKYTFGIIVFPNSHILYHEMQHAFDDFRSNKKIKSEYNPEEIRKHSANYIGGFKKEMAPYYLDQSELNAYFQEALKKEYWGEIDEDGEKIYSFKELLKQFTTNPNFTPWHYIDEKQKKKYINKLYNYYTNLKEKVFDKYGLEKGAKKMGLQFSDYR